MLATQDPADVVRAVADGVARLIAGRLSPTEREHQLDELAALYAERTDVRHPFSPLGDTPLRTRAELRAHFDAAGGRTGTIERFDWTDANMMRTDDPEVVVFEFDRIVGTGGREHRLHNVYVVRVRDGEIVESRDYADHVGLARAVGRLDALAASLAPPTADTDTDTKPDDRREIADLVARHGHLVDHGDLDRLEEVFTPEAGYDTSALGGEVLAGLEAVRSTAWQLGAANPVAHHVTNVVVTFDGRDDAHVESKGLGVMSNGTVGSVTYLDTARRTPQGWRLTHRVVRPRTTPLDGRPRPVG